MLVTVDVIYYRPDFRSILQNFVWQTEDVVPDFIRVHRFLNYWKDSIEAIISEVTVAYGTGDWRNIDYLIGPK